MTWRGVEGTDVAQTGVTVDPRHFRTVLGHVPTGVVVATAVDGGEPVGMAVGSFTSVSLDPPLVAFLPDKSSTSFPRIRRAGSFCINVLAGDQEAVCRSFAARGADKYAGTSWRPAGSGSPILDGVVAWIDCDIDQVLDAGDHHIVLGRVRDLQAGAGGSPLLFFQGGYGQFSTASRSAPAAPDLLAHLRRMDVARPEMEALAAELDAECLAVTVIGDEVVTLGGAGESYGQGPSDRVGQRMPFVPPLCALFVAWAGQGALEAWLRRLGPALTGEDARRYAAMVARVADRGWSLALAGPGQIALERALGQLSVQGPTPEQLAAVGEAARRVGAQTHEPEVLGDGELHVRNLNVPVFDRDGRVVLQLTLVGLPKALRPAGVEARLQRLLASAQAITRLLGGTAPVR